MDKLAALIANKRKSTEQEFQGRKFVKRSDLEEARLRKRQEEEAAEKAKRVGFFVACHKHADLLVP